MEPLDRWKHSRKQHQTRTTLGGILTALPAKKLAASSLHLHGLQTAQQDQLQRAESTSEFVPEQRRLLNEELCREISAGPADSRKLFQVPMGSIGAEHFPEDPEQAAAIFHDVRTAARHVSLEFVLVFL